MKRFSTPLIGVAVGCGVLMTAQIWLLRAQARPTLARKPEPATHRQEGLQIQVYRNGEVPPPRPGFEFDPMKMGGASVTLIHPPGQEEKAVVRLPKLADGRLDVVALPDLHVPGLSIVHHYYRFVVEFIQVENCCGEGERKETKLARYEFDPFRVNQGESYTGPVSLPVPHPGSACNINVQVEQGNYDFDADIGGIPDSWERVANEQTTIRADD